MIHNNAETTALASLNSGIDRTKCFDDIEHFPHIESPDAFNKEKKELYKYTLNK